MRTDSIKKFAVVGKIGSGKSYVCDIMINIYNIPVFNTDSAARELLNRDDTVKRLMKGYFGNGIYNAEERIISHRLADILFKDRKYTDISNTIIAPRIMCNFYQ